MVRFIVLGLLFALSAVHASAQTALDAAARTYPDRPVRIIVPFPAGGPTDINARIIGQKLSEMWGQAVVIENRPGGDTAIGAQAVAKAPPDGYTLLAAMDTTMVMNPATKASLTYDPFKDFVPVTLTAKNTSLLIVRASDGPKTVQELIARGRASPQKLNYGAGIILTRLAGYLFAKMSGFEAVLVPYKGSTEVVHGLLTSSVDFIVDGVASSLPLIQGGQFRPLAKLNSRPLTPLPDLEPLSAAAGLPGLADMSSWIGLVAPAGTPAGIIEKIYRDVVKVYADPIIADKLDKAGINAVTSAPAEFKSFIGTEFERWSKAFKDSGIKLE